MTKSFCWEKVGGKAYRNLHFNDLRRLKTSTRTEKIETAGKIFTEEKKET